MNITDEQPGKGYDYEGHVKDVKSLRQGLDGQLQKLKELPSTREVSLSITKIQEGIMWLGMELKRLGEANPYPDSYNPESPVIDKTADGLTL